MVKLYDTSRQTLVITELEPNSVLTNYLTTASNRKYYTVTFYSQDMIFAEVYRFESMRGVQFRQWATRHLEEFIVKGFLMDDECHIKVPNHSKAFYKLLEEKIPNWEK